MEPALRVTVGHPVCGGCAGHAPSTSRRLRNTPPATAPASPRPAITAAPVISGAIARGELPAATDPAELVKTLIAPIYLRLLVTAEPIDEATADHAAKVARAAASAGALRSATA
jgi:hypothetical protein